ncbi:hypothetical protein NQ314_011200 [Rhamnusium bicolor]|uniref:Uncharacterized protein n=1 Tax=Rhamnusium bicolor TaxID=1586634 RepID=A0AAV8XJR2_9CUCU|nr:hypothetical protein NQ314_011200 [Rhamnusium bicolor]
MLININLPLMGLRTGNPQKESQLIYLNVTGPENMELQQIEHLAPSEFWRKLGLLEKENLTFNDKL